MIIERNVFHLKFGKAKEAIALWKDWLEKAKKREPSLEGRLMTDLSGPSYTLILELHIKSFLDVNPMLARITTNTEWRAFYDQFIPLCDNAERTLYKIEQIV